MFERFKQKHDRTPPDAADRVPPGQYVTEKFPVLHYGSVPSYPALEQSWDSASLGRDRGRATVFVC